MTEDKSYTLLVTQLFGQRIAALAWGDRVVEIHTAAANAQSFENQIYKGVVRRVLPSHQCAFVDIGEVRNGYLQSDDVLVAGQEKTGSNAISDKLREGDSLVVQIKKLAKGSKGPRLTTAIGLPGIYVILLPLENDTAVSRRIANGKERERLARLLAEIRPEGMGLIARKVAEGVGEDCLRAEVNAALTRWNEIQSTLADAPAPSVIHQGLDPILRAICDLVGTPGLRVLIDVEDEFQRVQAFCNEWSPASLEKLESRPAGSLGKTWKLGSTLEKALGPRVWLRSGGFLMVEQTEAMAVVDVNTGKSEGKGTHQETVLSTNLEAVNEVARQLRLRNVAGLVVVDFIDMPLASDRRTVEKALKKALAADRSRCRVLPMSDMGIIEITRKRMGRSLDQDWLQSCPGCSGSGHVWADRPLASRAMIEMIRESGRPGTKVVHVDAHPQVIQAIRTHQGDELGALERSEDVAIQLHGDPALQLHDVKVYAR